MTVTRSTISVRDRLAGLTALLAIVGLVVGVPVLLLAVHRTMLPGLESLALVLTSPDDGTLLLVALVAVLWVLWACLAVTLLVEIAAALRRMRAPRLRLLPQGLAGRLVATAGLLFVSLPQAVQPSAASSVAPTIEVPAAVVPRVEPDVVPTGSAAPPAAVAAPAPTTVEYVVRRGDSLWKIARDQLGDPIRYTELVDLNRDALDGRPDFLVSGTVLRIPVPRAPAPADVAAQTYVVQPGDTLSSIAAEALGDPQAYPRIAEASAATVQPGGERLTDPDHIEPGWTLAVPVDVTPTSAPVPAVVSTAAVDAPVADAPDAPDDVAFPAETPGEVLADLAPASPAPTRPATDRGTPGADRPTLEPAQTLAPPAPQVSAAPKASEAPPSDSDALSTTGGVPDWLVPGLAGTGAVAAVGMLLALQRNRASQWRFRRPGRMIAPVPAELVPVERTAMAVAAESGPDVSAMDRLLRHLGAHFEGAGLPAPQVVTVLLSDREVTVRLAEPANLPAPWTGAGSAWTVPLDAQVEDSGWSRHPFLVGVGRDDVGRRVLLNLEACGTLTVTGDDETALGLVRYVAVELAVNEWSIEAMSYAVGLGDELAELAPMRLAVTTLEQATGPMLASLRSGSGDDDFHALLVAGPADVAGVSTAISDVAGRAGAVVVRVGVPIGDETVVEVGPGGRLRCASLGLDVQAAGLTAAEVEACARIVAATRSTADVPMPAADGVTDAAGAVRSDAVAARPDVGSAGPASLLPDAAAAYVEAAATTAEDVAMLAPVVDGVTVDDPGLDDDVRLWLADDCALPRLTLLGPVGARTRGTVLEVANRRPFYVSLLAYLALNPNGSPSARVAEAFGLSVERTRTDVNKLRTWLGVNPRTGEPHVPRAKSAGHTGSGYRVEDVLTDLDLFRRLRTRGQVRGADGITDLATALRLVTGEPFSELGTGRWGWLLEGERLDHAAVCAVVDVAHIVTTRALAENDLTTARSSAETARRAAPYDEVSRLDLAAVMVAEGHEALAERMLREEVEGRDDDGLGFTGLPDRTATVTSGSGALRVWRSGLEGLLKE